MRILQLYIFNAPRVFARFYPEDLLPLNGKGSAGLRSLPGPCKSVSAARSGPFNFFFNYSLLLHDPFFPTFFKRSSLSWAASILRGPFIIVPSLNGRQRVSLKSPSAPNPSKYLNRSLMGSQADPPDSGGGFVSLKRRGTGTWGGTGHPWGPPWEVWGFFGGVLSAALFNFNVIKHSWSKEKMGQTRVWQGWSSSLPVPTSPSLPCSSWSREFPGGRGGGRSETPPDHPKTLPKPPQNPRGPLGISRSLSIPIPGAQKAAQRGDAVRGSFFRAGRSLEGRPPLIVSSRGGPD